MIEVGLAERRVEDVFLAKPGDEPAQLKLVTGSQEDHGLAWREMIAEVASVRDGGMNGLSGLGTGRKVSPGHHVEPVALVVRHDGEATTGSGLLSSDAAAIIRNTGKPKLMLTGFPVACITGSM